ncbi:MAG: DUF1294 domain-containing protein [Oscillospiraceae bacterium]|nr:DUF1294 domain-containing protein [Oscillospiraceae bacterium]
MLEKYVFVILVAYIIVINIIGWVLPIIDKKKAQNNQWRIRESTLFIVSALGGSIAMLASMKKFRHKTKHKRFMIGIPLIIAVQIILLTAAGFFLIKK